MMKWLGDYYVCSHVGRVRSANEDNFFANGLTLPERLASKGFLRSGTSDASVQLYAVCDGMGGTSAGKEASSIPVASMRALSEALTQGCDFKHTVNDFVKRVNDEVVALSAQKSAGTTMTLLCLRDGIASVAHIGDSRAYHLHKGVLSQLTEDHTEAERMKRLRVGSGAASPSKSALTRYLGMDMPGLVVTPSYYEEIPLIKGDAFLLCSDGLHGILDAKELRHILRKSSKSPARKLVEAALAKGGPDNVTALVVDVYTGRG